MDLLYRYSVGDNTIPSQIHFKFGYHVGDTVLALDTSSARLIVGMAAYKMT